MTEDRAPLPCPLCGAGPARRMSAAQGGMSGVEIIANVIGRPKVWCGTCGCEGPAEHLIKDAIAAWNRRAGQAEAEARVARETRQAIVNDLAAVYRWRVESRRSGKPNQKDDFLAAIIQRIAGIDPARTALESHPHD